MGERGNAAAGPDDAIVRLPAVAGALSNSRRWLLDRRAPDGRWPGGCRSRLLESALVCISFPG